MTETTENEKLESGEPLCPVKKTSIGGQALIEGVDERGPQRTAHGGAAYFGRKLCRKWPTSGQDRPPSGRCPSSGVSITWWIPSVSAINAWCARRKWPGWRMRKTRLPKRRKRQLRPRRRRRWRRRKRWKPLWKRNCGKPGFGGGRSFLRSPLSRRPTHGRIGSGNGVRNHSPGTDRNAGIPGTDRDGDGRNGGKEKEQGRGLSHVLSHGAQLPAGSLPGGFLFMWLPSQLVNWLKPVFPAMENRVVRGVFEGVCKIALFIGYVSVVSLMKDIRRVFMYHGAEHKTIFCYEKGLPLTVENVRMQGRFHPAAVPPL